MLIVLHTPKVIFFLFLPGFSFNTHLNFRKTQYLISKGTNVDSYKTAHVACYQKKAKLAVIKSRQVFDFITNHIENFENNNFVKRNFYVGLRKNRKSLVFKWSDGTSFIETFNESQWMHGQNLFNSTKNCVTLNERHRKFEVTSCISWNAGYICQRQIITDFKLSRLIKRQINSTESENNDTTNSTSQFSTQRLRPTPHTQTGFLIAVGVPAMLTSVGTSVGVCAYFLKKRGSDEKTKKSKSYFSTSNPSQSFSVTTTPQGLNLKVQVSERLSLVKQSQTTEQPENPQFLTVNQNTRRKSTDLEYSSKRLSIQKIPEEEEH